MYAWGDDYHDVIRFKLHELVAQMRDSLDEPFDTRVCVDTDVWMRVRVEFAPGSFSINPSRRRSIRR